MKSTYSIKARGCAVHGLDLRDGVTFDDFVAVISLGRSEDDEVAAMCAYSGKGFRVDSVNLMDVRQIDLDLNAMYMAAAKETVIEEERDA